MPPAVPHDRPGCVGSGDSHGVHPLRLQVSCVHAPSRSPLGCEDDGAREEASRLSGARAGIAVHELSASRTRAYAAAPLEPLRAFPRRVLIARSRRPCVAGVLLDALLPPRCNAMLLSVLRIEGEWMAHSNYTESSLRAAPRTPTPHTRRAHAAPAVRAALLKDDIWCMYASSLW